jgi:hypothetical protein
MENVYTLYVDDHLDYYVNYGRWLQPPDVLIASRWSIRTSPAPVEITEESYSEAMALAWIRALTAQGTCEIVNQVETQEGRKKSVVLLLRILP